MSKRKDTAKRFRGVEMQERLLSGFDRLTDRPAWHLALVVWLVHGLLDGLVTTASVAYHLDSTLEANPLLRPYLSEALLAFVYSESYLPYWKPIALKFAVVGVGSVLLLGVAVLVSRRVYAPFCTLLIGVGLGVVAINLAAIGLGWFVAGAGIGAATIVAARRVNRQRLLTRRQVFTVTLALALVLWTPALLTGMGGISPGVQDHPGTAAAADIPHGDFVYFGEEDDGTGTGTIYTYDSDGSVNWSNTGYTNVWDATPGPNDEYVYAATSDKIIKFKTDDGTKVWNTSVYSDRFNNIRVHPDGSEVYAAHNGGNIIAFDTSDGTENWRYENPPSLVMGLGLSPDGETVYGSDWDSNIHAVNTADGTKKWNVSNGAIGRTVTTTTDGSSVLVGGNDGNLYSLAESDGANEWTEDYFADGFTDIQTSPDDTHLLYGRYTDSNGEGEAGKIDLSDRSIVWNNTYADHAQSHAPAPDESKTYVVTGSGDDIYALDWSDGSQVWTDAKSTQYYSADAGSYYAWAGTGGSDTGGESGTEQSVGLVEDDLEMFPASETELVVQRRTSEYYPLWEAAGYSVEEWREKAWEEEERSSFNWQNKTTVSLEDGEYYRLELHSPYGHWEDSGFEYDAAEMSDSTIWLAPETGHLDDNDDGTAGGSSSEGTNGPGSGDDGDGDDDGTPTATEEQGFGPTALGSCTTLDGQGGVEVEYWDPGYETYEFEANLTADGSTTYHIHKEFSGARGYYRGCLGDSVTNGSSDDNDLSWNHTARDDTGAIISNGTTSYNPPVFGPTGNAPDSTGERVGLLAGVLGALGVLWFGGQRYVPASSVSAWPSESISPAFGIGAPIVAVLGLDLAGGGVISASVATGLAQIAPFAGIVGVTVGGYAVLRWIRAPPS